MTTNYHSIVEVIRQWYRGADFNKFDTLYSVKFLWLNRFGSLCQFVASLTILAEIIGKERIALYIARIDAIVDLKKAFHKLANIYQELQWGNFLVWRYRAKRGIRRVLHTLCMPFFYLFACMVSFIVLIRLTILSLFEVFFLWPILGYLKLSEKEQSLKLVSFLLLLIGFIGTFLFSF